MATLLAQFSAHFPVWNTIRAAGLTSYLLMFVSVAAGISHSFSFFKPKRKKQLGRKTWKAIHFLAFPGYLLALYHGITSGTDTQQPLILGMYSITGCIVLILLFLRLQHQSAPKSQKKAQEN
ncbi:hypothetical protein [Priestia megaterium]|uniref:hypothetical protein n=1 Tax=Priestia megaterium TaxID=1404 RepID=UPI00298C1D64|nr:hypothetical protein [Priestia megaterium]